MDKHSIPQNRRSRRSNLWMSAALEHDGGMLPVTLRNLSADGALVEGDHDLHPGARIVFHKKDLAISGRIAWADGRRAGIAFDMSLDPETVFRHVTKPKKHAEIVHKRPGFRGAMSSEDREFASSLWGRPWPTIKR
jgi:hypothetical protein